MLYDYEVADFMETSPRTKHFKGENQLFFEKSKTSVYSPLAGVRCCALPARVQSVRGEGGEMSRYLSNSR